jgi:hypothetical protein
MCGSGKKYKKCCMKNNVVSLDSIRNTELNQLQFELMDFATSKHDEFFADLVDELIGDQYFAEDEEEVLQLYIAMWAIFTIPYEEEKTIIEDFVDYKKKENKLRASTLKQLETWAQTVPSYSIVTQVSDDLNLEIEDVFTREKKHVKLLDLEETVEVGGSLLGFLLPYGNHFTYFIMNLDFEANETPSLVSELLQNFEESDFDNEKDFMRGAFPGLILAIFGGELGEGPDIEKLEWENPNYEKVTTLYQKQIEEEELPKQIQDLGVMFWYLFCTKEKPVIRKPEIYAAALHYFVVKNVPFLEIYTQSEIAEMHNVNTSALSKAYRNLEQGLEDEMDHFYKVIENDLPDFDDVTFDDIFDEDDVDDDFEIDLDDLFLDDNEPPKGE